MNLQDLLNARIKDVPDFPKPGIVFKDITPLLNDGEAFGAFTQHLAERYAGRGITRIVGVESRGFIFGAALANQMGIGLALVRKPGKLPRPTRAVTYALEYGTDTLHIHADALDKGERVVIVDDVLATGGTALATAQLVESCGAHIEELAFLMKLSFLDGHKRLEPRPVYSALTF